MGYGRRADEDVTRPVEEDRAGSGEELHGRGQEERGDVGAVTAGGRFEVDPEVLLRAGTRMSSIGAQLDALSSSLGAALGSGVASGWDPAGAHFGLTYGQAAQEFADALAAAASAF